MTDETIVQKGQNEIQPENGGGSAVRSASFALSTLLFWIKGHASVDKRILSVRTANTILGFIPAGSNDQSIPIENISAASISTSYSLLPLLIGFLLIVSGLTSITKDSFVALLMVGVGVLIGGNGIKTVLRIQRAGSDYLISVPFFEKQKMLDIKDAIDEALVANSEQRDLGLFFDRK